MQDKLAAFITARLDEDERYAKAAQKRAPGPWVGAFKQVTAEPPGEIICVADTENADISHHIERQEPDRTLRKVDAKRAIAALHCADPCEIVCDTCHHDYPCATLRLLGAVWDDHPGYCPDWAPGR